jgi:hypothetical protein
VADGIAKPTLPRLRFHVGKANRPESKDSPVSGKQIVWVRACVSRPRVAPARR